MTPDADGYCYIARDHTPGAYAICIDRPELAALTAKTVARWIKEGARLVERLPRAEAVAELEKWERPRPRSVDMFSAHESAPRSQQAGEERGGKHGG